MNELLLLLHKQRCQFICLILVSKIVNQRKMLLASLIILAGMLLARSSPYRICTPKLTKNMVKMCISWETFGCTTWLLSEITQISIFFWHKVSCMATHLISCTKHVAKVCQLKMHDVMISWMMRITDSYAHVQKISSYHRNGPQCQLSYGILSKWKHVQLRSYYKNRTKLYTQRLYLINF